MSTLTLDHYGLQAKVNSQRSANITTDAPSLQVSGSTSTVTTGADKRPSDSHVQDKAKNGSDMHGNEKNLVRTVTRHGQDGHSISGAGISIPDLRKKQVSHAGDAKSTDTPRYSVDVQKTLSLGTRESVPSQDEARKSNQDQDDVLQVLMFSLLLCVHAYICIHTYIHVHTLTHLRMNARTVVVD
jgi:hypothetical protein